MADDPVTECLSAWRTIVGDVNGLATERTPVSTAVPRLLAAVEAALSFHQPVQLHEMAFAPDGTPRCGHDPESDPDAHYEGDDGEWYCESLPARTACSGCPGSPDGEYADHPCAEYTAILAALTGKEAGGG